MPSLDTAVEGVAQARAAGSASAQARAAGSGSAAALRRIRERAATEGAGATEERCDICSEQIDERHGHLVDLEQRRLLCACRPV
ncbi:MAG: DUF5947 family protein, partial [Acidimicrobiales bacterium]